MKYTGVLHNDLHVSMPIVIADRVTPESDHARRLVQIARHLYKHNRKWARRITDTNAGWDTLYAFMQHWYEAYKLNGRWIDEKGGN